MRYYVLATDYDGTLAEQGRVDQSTLAALRRLRESGRKLVLVTGRLLADLIEVFPHLELFDRVVAENGALLYRPASREERVLAAPPPAMLLAALANRGVPATAGRVIIATRQPYETQTLEVIRELGVELQLIFNKGAVMVLPSGINKATGLDAALAELRLSAHNVVAVGDAENDHAFMGAAECRVAVANALPIIRDSADWVTNGDHGVGVVQLIERLIASDLRELAPRLKRHEIALGRRKDGETVSIAPYGPNMLLAGTSGAGKSTLATGFLERLAARGYQYCIIDPEGDYESITGAVVLGDGKRAPSLREVMELLERPDENVVINLLAIGRDHRPAFFERLLPAILALRARTARPHWLVVDEAHHLLPAAWIPAEVTLPTEFSGLVLVTVHPDHVSSRVLGLIDLVLVIGQEPAATLDAVVQVLAEPPPRVPDMDLAAGEAMVWHRGSDAAFWLQTIPPKAERRRHQRKYAQGDLGEDRSFYFRGPQGTLNLRAQNLTLFLQLAEGVDDETWMYHLRRGDYSRWLREAIKDPELAEAVANVEKIKSINPENSRRRIRLAIEDRYTAPA